VKQNIRILILYRNKETWNILRSWCEQAQWLKENRNKDAKSIGRCRYIK